MNKRCAENEELLSAYLDGELRGDELVTVVEHLDGCVQCVATFHAIKEARTAVRLLPVLDIPDGLLPPYHLGDRLSAYLDGELDTVEYAAVSDHLSSCGECRDELHELDAARTAIRALPRLEPPVPLDLYRKDEPTTSWRRRGLVGLAAGSVAAVALSFALATPEAETPLNLDRLADLHNARVSVESGFSVIPASLPSGNKR